MFRVTYFYELKKALLLNTYLSQYPDITIEQPAGPSSDRENLHIKEHNVKLFFPKETDRGRVDSMLEVLVSEGLTVVSRDPFLLKDKRKVYYNDRVILEFR
jgi:hypothetical protein